MIGAISPRPIAWISTVSKAGLPNLAPFSFFNGVTADPPMISVCFATRDGAMKDTLSNILETKEFVVNVVEEAAGQVMVATSADFPPEVNEFEACGVEPEPSETVAPPRVKGAPAALECHIEQFYQFGNGPTYMVVACVLLAHLRDDILDEKGRIDPGRFTALGRLGRHFYGPVRETIEIPRPR